MLDDDHAGLGRQVPDQVPELGQLGFGQPAGRLVEEQHPRPGDKHAGQRYSLAQAVGQRVGHAAGEVRRANLIQCLQRPFPEHPLVLVRPRQPEQRGPESGARLAGGTDHHILDHRQPAEEADALQRAGDTEMGQPVRPEARQLPAVKVDRAGFGLDETAHHIEQSGLARPVRPDDPGYLPRSRSERNVVERREAAETDSDPLDVQ